MFFNKNFIAIAAINFCVMTGYYLLFVISMPYAMAAFDTSPGIAGLAAGLILIGCLAGRFVTGRLVSLVGFTKVLFSGLAIYCVGLALYLVAHDIALLMLVRFISGVGVGCIGTVTGTLVAHIIPLEQKGLGISYFSLSSVVALALGPFLGIFLMQRISFSTIFLFCLFLGVLSAGFACLLSAPDISGNSRQGTPRPGESPAKGGVFRVSDYIEYDVLPIAFVTVALSVCYGAVQAFLASFAEEAGRMEVASFFYLVYAVVTLCTRPVTGRLFDRKGPDIVIYPALFLTLCGLLLLSGAASSWGMLLAGALLGAGFGNYLTTAQSISIKSVPPSRFGQATSTHFIFLDLGIGIGPYLLGLIIPVVGYRGVFGVAAAITAVCFPLYFFLHGRRNTMR